MYIHNHRYPFTFVCIYTLIQYIVLYLPTDESIHPASMTVNLMVSFFSNFLMNSETSSLLALWLSGKPSKMNTVSNNMNFHIEPTIWSYRVLHTFKWLV